MHTPIKQGGTPGQMQPAKLPGQNLPQNKPMLRCTQMAAFLTLLAASLQAHSCPHWRPSLLPCCSATCALSYMYTQLHVHSATCALSYVYTQLHAPAPQRTAPAPAGPCGRGLPAGSECLASCLRGCSSRSRSACCRQGAPA